MMIEQGLFEGCVLQRNVRGVCDVKFSGTGESAGLLRATVRQGKRALAGFSDVRVGTAAAGRFAGRLHGIPAGGPYRVDLRIVSKGGPSAEAMNVGSIYVGDVWIAAGQSNMQGSGLKKFAPPTVPEVRAFYMDDRWDTAREPIHNMWACVDAAHRRINGVNHPTPPANDADVDGTMGPAIPFAYAMWKATGVPQAVIACAHGGTSMAQWDPTLPDEGGTTLYGATIRRVRKNGGRVAGVIWYQGCSDTGPETAAVYTARMQTLMAAFRRDCDDPLLPLGVVQLSRHIGVNDKVWWNAIQEQQRRLPESIERLTVVPAVDCALRDGIHLDGPGAVTVGNRLAQAMLHLQGHKCGLAPIDLQGWSLEDAGWETRIFVDFKNVVGSLRAGSRPAGLSVLDAQGLDQAYRIDLEGSRATLHTEGNVERLTGKRLQYGYGRDPYCNIVDEAGRSLPVFGPLLLGASQTSLPFIRRLRVSDPVRWTGSIRSVPCPPAKFKGAAREFKSDFCTIMCDLSSRAPARQLVHASFTLTAGEAMKLLLHLGYDGPVRVWLDDREVYCDPKGCSPSDPGDARLPLDVKRGRHRVSIALLSNEGTTWGIFARLERTDVPIQGLPESAPPLLPVVDC